MAPTRDLSKQAHTHTPPGAHTLEMHVAKGIYLITGGASLIGSHIADQLLADGAKEVRLLDNYSLGTPSTIAHLNDEPRIKRIKGDVMRMPDLLEAMQDVDGVFALAGYLTLPMAQDPLTGVSVNTLGMVNTLEACRFSGVRRVIFSSSVAVYGTPAQHPITEDAAYVSAGLQAPSLLYGASKLMGEALCARYARSFGLEFNSLRFASVYGERQHARAVNAVFVARVCDQVRRGAAPVIEGDGSEVHDYVYVTDVARACVLAMHSAVAWTCVQRGDGCGHDVDASGRNCVAALRTEGFASLSTVKTSAQCVPQQARASNSAATKPRARSAGSRASASKKACVG